MKLQFAGLLCDLVAALATSQKEGRNERSQDQANARWVENAKTTPIGLRFEMRVLKIGLKIEAHMCGLEFGPISLLTTN